MCDPKPPIPPKDPDIQTLFRRWYALHIWLNDNADGPDDLFDPINDRQHELAAKLCALPPRSVQDMAAKIISDTAFGIFELSEAIVIEARTILSPILLTQPMKGEDHA